MWGKHDETRDLQKNAHNVLASFLETAEELQSAVELVHDQMV